MQCTITLVQLQQQRLRWQRVGYGGLGGSVEEVAHSLAVVQ